MGSGGASALLCFGGDVVIVVVALHLSFVWCHAPHAPSSFADALLHWLCEQ
jgi:hypothetical protein